MNIRLDDALVTRIAPRALGTPEATLLHHEIVPLDYDAYLPGRTVTRVAGQAEVEGRRVPWSAVLKWTDSPLTTPTAPIEGGGKPLPTARACSTLKVTYARRAPTRSS